MPKRLQKTAKIEVYMTSVQKTRIGQLTTLNKFNSCSEYMLDCALNFHNDTENKTISLLKEQIESMEVFQQQQQRTMYIILQFIMFICSFTRSKEEIMTFYENVYHDAEAKYKKEDQ